LHVVEVDGWAFGLVVIDRNREMEPGPPTAVDFPLAENVVTVGIHDANRGVTPGGELGPVLGNTSTGELVAVQILDLVGREVVVPAAGPFVLRAEILLHYLVECVLQLALEGVALFVGRDEGFRLPNVLTLVVLLRVEQVGI
jgi:hypothetical protein